MFQRVTKHINPATILAFVALIFAPTGGAFAATGGGGDGGGAKATASATHASVAKKKKKAKPKSTRGPAGPKGANGATGANGAVGSQGPVGPAGAQGAKGENGAAGVGKEGLQGLKGETGATGKEGTTGFTETLPSGATETGTWSISMNNITTETYWYTPISFPIPLKKGAEETTYFFTEAQTEKEEFEVNGKPTGCAWEESNPNARPTAPAGTLCIFTHQERNEHTTYQTAVASGEGPPAYGPTGATLIFLTQGATVASPGEVRDIGVWAVTAP